MKPQTPIQSKPNMSRLIIGIMLAVVLLGGAISFLTAGGKSHRPMVKTNDIVTITLPPPPPPPPLPPPPPPPPPKEQEMVEQTPVDTIEEPVEAPVEAPDDALGTNITGNGPDMGLRAGGGNGGTRNQIGSGRRAGKWDRYAVTVQNIIAETLRRNSGVRSAAFSLKVRVWADAYGRITRARLMGTSGTSAVDQAIKDQVLVGLQLPEPPPADMPMPINMRISARNPNLTMR